MSAFNRVLVFLLICTAITQSQENIRVYGTIVDRDTHKPVPFVNIRVAGTASGVAADSVGFFQIRGLKAGTHILEFRCIGYNAALEKLAVRPGSNTGLLVEMSVEPVQMKEIVVTDSAYLERFRHQYPGSKVFTRDLIEQTKAISFTEALRTLAPQISLYNIRSKSRRTLSPPRITLLIDERIIAPSIIDGYDDQSWLDKYIEPQEIEYMIIHRGANAWIRAGKRGQIVDYVIEIKTRGAIR
jgi:hypothetical protein